MCTVSIKNVYEPLTLAPSKKEINKRQSKVELYYLYLFYVRISPFRFNKHAPSIETMEKIIIYGVCTDNKILQRQMHYFMYILHAFK